MKPLFLLLIASAMLYSCTQKELVPVAWPPYTGIEGRWKWVSAYETTIDTSVLLYIDKGTITFSGDSTFTRLKRNGVADSGRYALFHSVIPGIDSLHFYRNTASPAFPIMDSTYDYYVLKGDTLKLGIINPSATSSWAYGSTDVYIKQ